MTDRELLEAAAKAAGLNVGDWLPGVLGLMLYEGNPGSYTKRRWNPFFDGGDALRLAVALQLEISPLGNCVQVGRPGAWETEVIYLESDPMAAACRAIVRAAATIGAAVG